MKSANIALFPPFDTATFPLVLANPMAGGMAAGLAKLLIIVFVAALCRAFLRGGIVTLSVHKSAGERAANFHHPLVVSTAVYCAGTVATIAGTFLLLRSLSILDNVSPSLFPTFGGMLLLGSVLELTLLIRVLECPEGAAILAWFIDPFWFIALLLIGW